MIDDELLPINSEAKEESIIKVIGVGGGGGNAVNHMMLEGVEGVDFVIANTDLQALGNSPVLRKIQLGENLTDGLGAGNKPAKGKDAAEESRIRIDEVLSPKTKMVFITAGMGGGTGTGAAPVIAEAACKKGILTVGIVTIPFRWERQERMQQAINGITELEQHVDALLVVNNEGLRREYGDLKLSEAFAKADDVLLTAAKGIAEIITLHGHISVDFADVESVMRDSGVALMGVATAAGDNRAINVIKKALESPLLNSNDIEGAKNILLNIVYGEKEVLTSEVTQMMDYLLEVVGEAPNVIHGICKDDSLKEELRVTLIATGFEENPISEIHFRPRVKLNNELTMKVEDAAEVEKREAQRREARKRRREEEEIKRKAEEQKQREIAAEQARKKAEEEEMKKVTEKKQAEKFEREQQEERARKERDAEKSLGGLFAD